VDEIDTDDLERALLDADIPVLLMILVHLTGDRRWIRAPYRPERDGRIFAGESGGLPEPVQAEVRAAAKAALISGCRAASPAELGEPLLAEMMSTAVGEPVPGEYVPLLLQEMGFRPSDEAARVRPRAHDRKVVIIGAGVSGVCAAIKLKALGIPFVVLEKNPAVGGTWLENTYPECGVDTPNHFYSYSFAPNPDWGWYFSKQGDIRRYIEDCADRFGIREHIRCSTMVTATRYRETAQTWETELTLPDGSTEVISSDVVITAVGQLNEPKMPDLPGMNRFVGTLIHTARWPEDLDLTGKRVALVGAGASAVQAARTIARRASSMTIFQRSPHWVTPNPDYHRAVSDAKRWLFRHVPYYASWYRFGLFWRYGDGLHSSLIVDPDWPHQERSVNERNERHRVFLTRYLREQLEGRTDLIEKCLPDYPPYGKRMVIDNEWFATLRRENVELVTESVTALTDAGIRTADGAERDFDVVVMATGFMATRMLWPLEVTGRDGASIHDIWEGDECRAYLGMTVPRFPNFFMLLGPNTALAHGGSVIFQIEAQLAYVTKSIGAMVENGIGTIEPRREAYEEYIAAVEEQMGKMVYSHDGMNNWYKNRAGRIVTVSPWRLVDYWWMTRAPDLDEFVLEPAVSTVTR
jgi:4-hydroxyacetophenone monooxygenase